MQDKYISKVILIVPPLVRKEAYTESDSRPDFESLRLVSPMEPLTVAAVLRGNGFVSELFDMGTYVDDVYSQLKKKIVSVEPDAVVITQAMLTFATSHDWDGREVFDLVREIVPNCTTVLSGGHATNYPGKAVNDGVCDYSIRGEIDFSLLELLEALNDGQEVSDIDGVAYKLSEGGVYKSANYPMVDVSKLPVPAYDLLDEDDLSRYYSMPEKGKIRYPEMSRKYRDIVTSKGCILRCSFCSVAHSRGEKQRYRRKPISLVIDEVEQALDQGVEEIHFFDDLFAENEGQLLELANGLSRRNLQFPWFVAQGMPLWPVSKDALLALSETGMYRLICPMESGNDRVLKKSIGKLASVEHNRDVVSWAHDIGLEIIAMYVVGMPDESRDEIADTLRFAESLNEVDYSVFSIATPMVGTRMTKKLERNNQQSGLDKVNKIIKRTLALYRTDAFSEVEMGVIRAFDWDRINFTNHVKREKYAKMVGVTLGELDQLRQSSFDTFHQYFPDYSGPKSFLDLIDNPDLGASYSPSIK